MDSLASSLSDFSLGSDEEEEAFQPFRFFALPAELRRKILDLVYHLGKTLDIDLRVVRLLSTFLVSNQWHAEASQSFYGSNTFRLLPTHGRAAGRHAMPLIKCFSPPSRAQITSCEFRLGPFWTNPPRCWVIDDALGLEDAVSLRLLKVFIEIDPSHAIFNGFRSARLSYTDFSGTLLSDITKRLPNLSEVQIDGYPSVTRDLPLMNRIFQVAVESGMRVSWGPGQESSSARPSRRNSIDFERGMVPFYSSSPFHRRATGDAYVVA